MKSRPQALVQLHLAVLLFGVSGLIGQWVSASPIIVACVRSLVAGATLLSWMNLRKTGQRARFTPAHRGLLLLGGSLLAAHWWSFFAAIQGSTVALGLLTFASYPLFACMLGWWLLREPMRFSDAIACLAVLAGLALVVPDWHFGSKAGFAAFLGIISGFTFAMLTLLNRRLITDLSPLALVGAQTGIAGLILLPWTLDQWNQVGRMDWLALLLLGVVFTGVAHACFTASLTHVRVANASIAAALEPVYGIALAWLWLGEEPSLRMMVGGLLIISSAIFSARAEENQPTLRPPPPANCFTEWKRGRTGD